MPVWNFPVRLLLWSQGVQVRVQAWCTYYCCVHPFWFLLPAVAPLHAPHGIYHKVNRRPWDRKWLRTSMKPWSDHRPIGMQSEWAHKLVRTRNAGDLADRTPSPLPAFVFPSLQPFHDHTACIPWWVTEQISEQWATVWAHWHRRPGAALCPFLSILLWILSPAPLPPSQQWGTKVHLTVTAI